MELDGICGNEDDHLKREKTKGLCYATSSAIFTFKFDSTM